MQSLKLSGGQLPEALVYEHTENIKCDGINKMKYTLILSNFYNQQITIVLMTGGGC